MIKALKKLCMFIAACVIFVVIALFGAGGKKTPDNVVVKPAEDKTAVEKNGKSDIVFGASVFMYADYGSTEPSQSLNYTHTESYDGTGYSSSTAGTEGVLASLFDDGGYAFDSDTFADTSDVFSESDTVFGEAAEIAVPEIIVDAENPSDAMDYDNISYYAQTCDDFEAKVVTDSDDNGDITVNCELGFFGTDYFS